MTDPSLHRQIFEFYKLLSNKNNSIALPTSWAIFFALPGVLTGENSGNAYSNENRVTLANITSRENKSNVILGENAWGNLPSVVNTIYGSEVKKWGWMYAARVNIPGDGYDVAPAPGDFSVGFPKGNIGRGRTTFQKLSIDFYDTNASVTDYILRPWSILMAHNSLKIADAKSIIHILPLMRTFESAGGNAPRKIFSFFNCWPSSIGNETLSHESNAPIIKSTQFTYDWYSVTNISDDYFNEPNPSSEGVLFDTSQVSEIGQGQD